MNKKEMFKLFLWAGIVFAGAFIFFSINSKETKETLPIEELKAVYALDMSDEKAVIEHADVVVLGKVVKETGVSYDQDGMPYTSYNVEVKEKLKGELKGKLNKGSLSIVKSGGVTEEGSSVMLYEHDILPKEKKEYIFVAYEQEDGALLVTGENSTLEVVASDKKDNGKKSVYKTYKEIANNLK